MFNKKTDENEGPLLTVMGISARLEGKFNITESIHIECEVAGEINVDGMLVIGDRGVVKADVHTTDAIIMGQYEGKHGCHRQRRDRFFGPSLREHRD